MQKPFLRGLVSSSEKEHQENLNWILAKKKKKSKEQIRIKSYLNQNTKIQTSN